MRLHQPVALLTALAVALPAAHAAEGAAEPQPVQVKDFSVRPMANLAYADNKLVVHPKVLVGIGYDSNVYAETTDENSGMFVHGLAGVVLDYRLNPHQSLAFDGEFETVTYLKNENDDADLVGGRAAADYRWEEARNNADLHLGYARFNDPLIQTGEQVLRQTVDGHIGGEFTSSVVRSVVQVGIVSTDYLEDATYFTESSRDNNQFDATLRIGYSEARDTFYYALLGYQRVAYDEDTQFNSSNGVTGGLGLQVRLGERSRLTAEAGATYRVYDNNYAGNTAWDDEKVLAPYLNVAAVWPWEEGSHVGVRLFSRLDESITANAAWVYGGILDGRLRMAQHTGLFASVGVYQTKDSGSGSGIQVEERTTTEGQAGIEHELRRGVVVRAKGTYTDSDSKTANDFTRTILALEAAAAF
jgi:hypothetical protein